MSNEKAYLVSTVDKVLDIPRKRRPFNNEHAMRFKLTAGVPQEVPLDVALTYSKAYPNIYSIVDGPEGNTEKEDISSSFTIGSKETEAAFNPETFLAECDPLTKDVLIGLDEKELFQISNFLGIRVPYNIKKEKHCERILANVEALKSEPVE